MSKCILCGQESEDKFCPWCRYEARKYIRKFSMYDGNKTEDLREVLFEELEEMEDRYRNRRATLMRKKNIEALMR